MKKLLLTLLIAMSLSATVSAGESSIFLNKSTQGSNNFLESILNEASKNSLKPAGDFESCHLQCVFDFQVCQSDPNIGTIECSKIYNSCYNRCVRIYF
ncbi:hypothetical protein [Marinicella sp. W31]|uniref:hypothetical protein n=1 Tax=Marinicella sp. W31 TaxID=3023713 RepID=UPI003756C970